jgi:hypothetical protein
MRKEPIVAFLIALSVVASGCLNGDDGSEQDTNKAPTAQIESVTPSPAYAGQTVTFAGSGSDEDGFHLPDRKEKKSSFDKAAFIEMLK